MRRIKNWTAIRSGKTQTVAGFDPTSGAAVKVTHVTTIVGNSGKVIARTAAEDVELVID